MRQIITRDLIITTLTGFLISFFPTQCVASSMAKAERDEAEAQGSAGGARLVPALQAS